MSSRIIHTRTQGWPPESSQPKTAPNTPEPTTRHPNSRSTEHRSCGDSLLSNTFTDAKATVEKGHKLEGQAKPKGIKMSI